jgi:hypothetical protein
MKKLCVKLRGADGKIIEVVFNTDDYKQLKEILEKHGLNDYKIIDWKLKNIKFYE